MKCARWFTQVRQDSGPPLRRETTAEQRDFYATAAPLTLTRHRGTWRKHAPNCPRPQPGAADQRRFNSPPAGEFTTPPLDVRAPRPPSSAGRTRCPHRKFPTWPQYAAEISRPRRGWPTPSWAPLRPKWAQTMTMEPIGLPPHATPASVTKWPHMHASGTSAGPASDIYSEHRAPFPTQAVLHATPRAQGSAAATLSRHPRRSHMGCARELHEAMAGPANPASTPEEGLSFLASITPLPPAAIPPPEQRHAKRVSGVCHSLAAST